VVSLAAWSRLLRSFTGRKILQEIGKAPPYEEFVYPIRVSGVNLFLVLLNFTKMKLPGSGATGPYGKRFPSFPYRASFGYDGRAADSFVGISF
jgi:hypothetical protein